MPTSHSASLSRGIQTTVALLWTRTRAVADGAMREGVMSRKFTIRADWDDDAKVWVATSDEVLGLATEADTIPHLVEKLERILPELLVENGQLDATNGLPDVPFCVMHEHVARVSAH